MSRPLLPSTSLDPSESSSPSTGREQPNRPQYAKRGKITIVACVPCRKRKTKCDGVRPTCGQCAARDGECNYDMTDDQRRLTYLREHAERLETMQATYIALYGTLQNSSEDDASDIMRRIRSGEPASTVAAEVHAGKVLYETSRGEQQPSPSGSESSQKHLSSQRAQSRVEQYDRLLRLLSTSSSDFSAEVLQRIRMNDDVTLILQTMDNRYGNLEQLEPDPSLPMVGPESTWFNDPALLSARRSREVRHDLGPNPYQRPQWTEVTTDQELIRHLMDLYFTWQHAFFQNFPEELFRSDFENGKAKYCSASLVNAICACGCFLSMRESVRNDRAGNQILVQGFYNEAMSFLNAIETPNITDTAALYLISYVEGFRGRPSGQWMLAGRSALMALDLRLHLQPQKSRSTSGAQQEAESQEATARAHSFWGCFHVMQCNSLMLGRLPIFPGQSISLELPSIDAKADDLPWAAYEMSLPNRPGARSTTFKSCAELSKIVNANQFLFYAPTERLSGSRLIDQYEMYLEWYRGLSDMLFLDGGKSPPPHVLCLHFYYHCAVLLLWRPFLGRKITGSSILPRDVCRQSSDATMQLWEQHRRLFGTSGIWQFQVNCLLVASTVYLVSLPDAHCDENLVNTCNIFQELLPWQGWAHEALGILRELVEEWNMSLSRNLTEALYRGTDQPAPGSDTQGSGGASDRQLRAPTGRSGWQVQGEDQRRMSMESPQQVRGEPAPMQRQPVARSPKRLSGTPNANTPPTAAPEQKRPRVTSPQAPSGSSYPNLSQQAASNLGYEQSMPQTGFQQQQQGGGNLGFMPPPDQGHCMSSSNPMYEMSSGQKPMLSSGGMGRNQSQPGQLHMSKQQQHQQPFSTPSSSTGSSHPQRTQSSRQGSRSGLSGPQSATSSADETLGLHGGVEGLSFAEDWRAPYLTFQVPPQPPPDPGDSRRGQ